MDDDPKALDLIALRMTGLVTHTLRARGGQEAIETARRELPNLILLDLLMPEVSGFDVVTALNEHPETADIPILIVTAKHVNPDDRARLNGYVTAIMEKANFDLDRFTAEVRRALSRRPMVA